MDDKCHIELNFNKSYSDLWDISYCFNRYIAGKDNVYDIKANTNGIFALYSAVEGMKYLNIINKLDNQVDLNVCPGTVPDIFFSNDPALFFIKSNHDLKRQLEKKLFCLLINVMSKINISYIPALIKTL